MKPIKLSLAHEFSRTPGPRYADEGDFSGEEFRHSVLSPLVREAMAAGKSLFIDIDGTAGYGTSFLEEAFGGLVRNENVDGEELISRLQLKSDEEPYLISDIIGYIREAQQAKDKDSDNA